MNKARNFLPINSLKFIQTNENLPDVGTRRTKPDVLLSKNLWWKGPSLLNNLYTVFFWFMLRLLWGKRCMFFCWLWNKWLETRWWNWCQKRRVVVAMKSTAEFVSGIGAIINAERFREYCKYRHMFCGFVRNCLKGRKKRLISLLVLKMWWIKIVWQLINW